MSGAGWFIHVAVLSRNAPASGTASSVRSSVLDPLWSRSVADSSSQSPASNGTGKRTSVRAFWPTSGSGGTAAGFPVACERTSSSVSKRWFSVGLTSSTQMSAAAVSVMFAWSQFCGWPTVHV